MDGKNMHNILQLHTSWSTERAVPANPVSIRPFPRLSMLVEAEFISALIRKRQKVLARSIQAGGVHDEKSHHVSNTINNVILLNIANVVHIIEERERLYRYRLYLEELLETQLLVDLVRADDLDQDALGTADKPGRAVHGQVIRLDFEEPGIGSCGF
ncbi:hypothetical protein V5O48_017262 [Marasmius crinis-equi]|uniref:Uncharacterized protein n=1 Tax=Marasmius crinis-equi TaxID=585013 RepID=A0ABR3EPP7_9AGAR